MKKYEFWNMINYDNNKYLIIPKEKRKISTLLYFFWWLLQLFLFYLPAIIATVFFIIIILLICLVSTNRPNRILPLFIYILLAPFIWWYRYFKFGFINILNY